jgi:hypothetical protein
MKKPLQTCGPLLILGRHAQTLQTRLKPEYLEKAVRLDSPRSVIGEVELRLAASKRIQLFECDFLATAWLTRARMCNAGLSGARERALLENSIN